MFKIKTKVNVSFLIRQFFPLRSNFYCNITNRKSLHILIYYPLLWKYDIIKNLSKKYWKLHSSCYPNNRTVTVRMTCLFEHDEILT